MPLGRVAEWVKALQLESDGFWFKSRQVLCCTQPRYEAHYDLWVENVESAMIKVGLGRLLPQKWPKVCRGTAK